MGEVRRRVVRREAVGVPVALSVAHSGTGRCYGDGTGAGPGLVEALADGPEEQRSGRLLVGRGRTPAPADHRGWPAQLRRQSHHIRSCSPLLPATASSLLLLAVYSESAMT